MPLPLGFTGARLDRADQMRTNAEAFAAATADPRATCLTLDGIDFVPGTGGGLLWEPLDPADDRALMLLGIDDAGAPRFVREAAAGTRVDARSRTVMRLLPLLSAEEAALYGGARSLVDWHARHRFCAVCGSPTDLFRGGWGRRCGSCNAEHFPRVDPVVIMLAEFEGRVLVGRQGGFPPGFFSALAGFVEPGESLEEAVARELFEEAGIHVTDVSYVASQPWPFPSSLMIGCRAVAKDPALTLDTTEIEAAMWVDRAEVRAALAGEMGASFLAPPSLAIARYLLEDWAEL
ncbi:NAD(+) diphosphatase [Sphingopyxis chilensis]|uniref:NAD(+) diphosphatase n=1 Tax=Sphingopyxis chilensis TaxID=180400 RepID=UPI002DDD0EB4|nr:NAD(+) diphosphatase [Sphingopyxis chilensis]